VRRVIAGIPVHQHAHVGTLRAAGSAEGAWRSTPRRTSCRPTGSREWADPDGSTPPAANLDPVLDVMLLERRGEWAFIRAAALKRS